MELKQKLQDYARAEFEYLVQKITDVKGALGEHNQLVNHFDKLVKHPKGADLLFYPDVQFLTTGVYGVGDIVYTIKKWHNDNGQLAFSDDTFPPVRPKPTGASPSAEERARTASSENLVKTTKVIQRIEDARHKVESVFSLLDGLLNPVKEHPGSGRDLYIAQERQLANIEAALHEVVLGVQRFNFLDMTVRFAKDDAIRSISFYYLDHGIQSSILQQISAASDRYLAQKAIIAARHSALHVRAQAVIQDLEEKLIRLASATGVGPLKDESVLVAMIDDIDVLPRIITAHPDNSSSSDKTGTELKQAIRSAVSGLTWEATLLGEGKTVKHASVMSFRFDTPGCGERFAISLPLSDFMPSEGQSWQELAQANAEVDLPFRMSSGVAKKLNGKLSHGLREITELAHIYVVPTNGTTIASKVKVRSAVLDVATGAYRFVRPGRPVNQVLWMPQSLSNLDDTSDRRSTRISNTAPVRVPVVEAIPFIEDLGFDDCIVVFPCESELEPVYIMFKRAWEYPGVATGAGQLVSDNWLQAAATETGAVIPSSIADQLRDKVFKRFSFFREAFWKAVASDSELAAQFSPQDLAAMTEGWAPSAQRQSGKLEIRYVLSPEDGGDVYDMDNMRIFAPLVV
ncbi:S-type pyocin domain-containing protein [Pseudomonas caspiana]|uniref:S-type pyocin domain-containing protein n=1 Tax=Pseudomonas caspiana TaxID=1451454 RepID=UPI0032EB2A13